MIQRILIVDDEPEILSAFSELLQNHGFDVTTAGNAEEFEQAILSESPDLIILDIVMHNESGPDLYDRVMPRNPALNPPLVYASGLIDSHSEKPLAKGNRVGMYSKPLNVDKLVRDIRTAFPDSLAA